MTALRDWIWLGLAIGAIWAFTGIEGAALAVGLAIVGAAIGLVVHRPDDVRALLSQRDDRL